MCAELLEVCFMERCAKIGQSRPYKEQHSLFTAPSILFVNSQNLQSKCIDFTKSPYLRPLRGFFQMRVYPFRSP